MGKTVEDGKQLEPRKTGGVPRQKSAFREYAEALIIAVLLGLFLARTITRPVRELTLFALQRQARNDPVAAAGYWDTKLRAKFSAEEQAYAWGQLALQAAPRCLRRSIDLR